MSAMSDVLNILLVFKIQVVFKMFLVSADHYYRHNSMAITIQFFNKLKTVLVLYSVYKNLNRFKFKLAITYCSNLAALDPVYTKAKVSGFSKISRFLVFQVYGVYTA